MILKWYLMVCYLYCIKWFYVLWVNDNVIPMCLDVCGMYFACILCLPFKGVGQD